MREKEEEEEEEEEEYTCLFPSQYKRRKVLFIRVYIYVLYGERKKKRLFLAFQYFVYTIIIPEKVKK